MRTPSVLLVLFAVTSALTGTAGAQTLYGQGGLLIHPTAFTPARRSLTFSASTFNQRIPGERQTEWVPLGLSYAITDRLEVGAIYVDRLDPAGRRRGSGGIFVRQQILSEKAGRPAFALTGSYLGSDIRLASVSAVASSHINRRGRTLLIGHAGVQWGWRGDGIPPSDSVSAFVGAEIPLNRELSLLAEFGTRFSFDFKERSALGVLWRSRQGFSLALGYVNVGRSEDNRFFVGVGYPLGGSK